MRSETNDPRLVKETGVATRAGAILRSVFVARNLGRSIGALRNVPPFFRIAWQASRALIVGSLLLRLTRAVTPVATLYIAGLVVDEVVRLAQLNDHPPTLVDWLGSGVLGTLFALMALSFGLLVLSDIINRVAAFVDSLLGEKLTIEMSTRLIEHTSALHLAGLEDSEVQNMIERARRQAANSPVLMVYLAGQVQGLLTLVALGMSLVLFVPGLVAIVALALLPGFVLELYFAEQAHAVARDWTEQARELDYIRWTGASLEAAKEVKLFGLASFLVERFRTRAADLYKARRRLTARHGRWGATIGILSGAGYIATYAYLAWATAAGRFTLGDFTFLSGAFVQLRAALADVNLQTSKLIGQALYIGDLLSFLRLRPSVLSPVRPRPFPRPVRRGVRFEDVSFRYPGAERWAIRSLSFEIRPGELIALIGENGAGKTTVVKLLTRLYDPDEGRILLDGCDLRDYDLAELRMNVGAIFQDFMKYDFTAAENIAVGKIEAIGDQTRIESAAKRSMADEVICGLPMGYDQRVGRRFKTGVDLSIGEWQRIAIARAYMRDAQILILDEPTAALDARAEYRVFNQFRELSAGRTAVLISHRFSSVRMVDRILVLKDGAVESLGTHDRLVAEGGKYAELFALQAAGYR